MAWREPDVAAADVGGPATELRQRFAVPFEYPVTFTEDAFAPANPVLRDALARCEPARRHRMLVVLDHGVRDAWPELAADVRRYADAHAATIELVADAFVVPGGEQVKNDPAVVSELHRLFYDHRLDRHAFVVVVGGGAVQDAAGWAAATAHRGLRTVRMPSTVLSQCDSGVGVKNGVNAFGVKNFLGTFAPPFAVVVDARFLERLPRRDAIAGLAEAVKVALIRDASFFAWLEANAAALSAREPWALAALIRRCAALHLDHIATSGDPFEMGSARPLDFGHWAAHKLESLAGPDLPHGEAVAIGLLLDTRYSVESGLLAATEGARIERLLRRLGLPRWNEAVASPELLGGLDEFREHLGGELSITLLRGIGHAVEVHEMDRARIASACAWLAEAPAAS
jgi:3-dehydroquinate synthase